MGWRFVVPNLAVRDVPAAQAWYRDTLGMDVNWIWEDNFGSVSRDHVELFIFECDEPRPGICSIWVDDVDGIYERCGPSGSVVSELELKPWGVREFSIKDPDGNVLRIGRGEGEPADREKFTVVTEAK
jgi:catechol 2,3-dioxygenase-like lactoylglutathione lyase family enzyme